VGFGAPRRALRVARNGRLAAEEYFGAGSASQPHTMQSVTKSVVSLLTGLAVRKRVLGVDDCVLTFFPSTSRPRTSTIARRLSSTPRGRDRLLGRRARDSGARVALPPDG
jgi:CubicO group peptidase (beta-lactamase class C family)